MGKFSHTVNQGVRKRRTLSWESSTFNEEGLLQGMRGVSYQVRVWKVEDRVSEMREKNFRLQIRTCRVGMTGSKIIRPDPQASRAQGEKPQATTPNDPLFNSGSRRNYVSKNSTHSFGRYRRKRDERHRRGASHVRI